MKVHIKKFDVDMQVKTNGIELEVRTADDKTQLGDCYITQRYLIWCNGKTTKANGVNIQWADFAAICKSKASVAAAVKAAKLTK